MQIMVVPRIACVNCCPLLSVVNRLLFSVRIRSFFLTTVGHCGPLTHARPSELYPASMLRKRYVLLARNLPDTDARPIKNLLRPYGPDSNHDCPRRWFEFVLSRLGIKRPLALCNLSICLFQRCNSAVSVGWILVLANLYLCLSLELASGWFICLRANLARDGTLLACSPVS